MSDNWIVLISEDPTFVPESAKRTKARARFVQIAPESHEIEIQVFDHIEFFDCGANLERILCPSCRSEISTDWWQDTMEADYRNGFLLDKYAPPCCNATVTLHELIYEWPQGFGRFALTAMNPNIGTLDDQHKKEFEQILGTKLHVIYQHS